MSEYLPVGLRRLVVRRAASRCEYCCSPDTFSPAPFEIDHIFPQSQGGLSTADNLAYSCPNCNGSKSAAQMGTDPQTNQLVLLFNPRRQLWGDHLVQERAGSMCEYCRCPSNFSPGPFDVDHIVPRTLNGPDDSDNFA
ncbi:hypothetical protein IAD21_00970 [Abditibacteriota bacterium]|nr:hypothetical protein IAD21_00970 [Abditibacteriota bacterium]